MSQNRPQRQGAKKRNLIANYLPRPGGRGALLLMAPIPIFIVIFSGSGGEKKFSRAGIDKNPETPNARILTAARAIVSSRDPREVIVEWKE
jgi:hypothetical protein